MSREFAGCRDHHVQRSWRIVQSFQLRRSASSAEDSVVIEMHSMGQETVDMSIYDGVSVGYTLSFTLTHPFFPGIMIPTGLGAEL